MKKPNFLEVAMNMALVKRFLAKEIDFVIMPVKDAEHRIELMKMAEDITREDAVAKNKAAEQQGEKDEAAAGNDSETMKSTLESLSGDQLKQALVDINEELKPISAAAKAMNLTKEVRGLAPLGFVDGIGTVVLFTDNEEIYNRASDLELSDLVKRCSNPECKACHPDSDSDSDSDSDDGQDEATIH